MTTNSRIRWRETRPLARLVLCCARSKDGGQGLAEFALVAPILILLVMAIFQFAYVFQTQMGLTNAVREAARRAAAAEAADAATFRDWVQLELTAGDGLLAANVPGYDATRLSTNPPTVSFCSYVPVGGLVNQTITVTVSYNHPIFFPVPGSNGLANLTASAQMRLENPLSAPPASC